MGPIVDNKYCIREALERVRVGGDTALYDAVKEAVKMTDAAKASEDAIRGVVVLTDGHANRGVPLDQLLGMSSRDEKAIASFSGFDGNNFGVDVSGGQVKKVDVMGQDLVFPTSHQVKLFFVGIADADFEVGRMLAEATGGASRGAKPEEVRAILEQFGKYF